MPSSDRMVLIGLPLVAVVVGFWFLVLSPKQKESGELSDRIGTLQTSIASAEAEISSAEAARKEFPENYSELVSLGKAVPEGDDQSTLVYDLVRLARVNKVGFRDLELTAAAGSATTPVTPPPATADPVAGDGAEATPVAAAPATETDAAALPIGATVGAAGLPVMPYDFRFNGDFFRLADFFGDLDRSVRTRENGDPLIRGRLLTVDGFSLSADSLSGFPKVEANFAVTSYVVPPDQGIQAGATPAGPAPVGAPGTATPVSVETTGAEVAP